MPAFTTFIPFNQNLTVGRTSNFPLVPSISWTGGVGPWVVSASSDNAAVVNHAAGDVTVSGAANVASRAVFARLQAGATAGATALITLTLTDSFGLQTSTQFRVAALGACCVLFFSACVRTICVCFRAAQLLLSTPSGRVLCCACSQPLL